MLWRAARSSSAAAALTPASHSPTASSATRAARDHFAASPVAGAGLGLIASGRAFAADVLTPVELSLCWSAIFFVASAAASSAYLTVSEVFPALRRLRAGGRADVRRGGGGGLDRSRRRAPPAPAGGAAARLRFSPLGARPRGEQ